MIKSEIFDLLLKCNSAQLDAITTKLELNRDFLPGQGQAIATRAIGIVELAEQRDLLAKLEAVLLEIFPRTARTWAAPDDVPPPHIDKQVASPDFADTRDYTPSSLALTVVPSIPKICPKASPHNGTIPKFITDCVRLPSPSHTNLVRLGLHGGKGF